ncbi:MAG: hypothetical protein ACK4RS_03060 [Thiothrix sp.]
MSQEIADLLVKHLPTHKSVVLSGDTVHCRSHTCVQVFGHCPPNKAVFSLKTVFRRPPPNELNVQCVTPSAD